MRTITVKPGDVVILKVRGGGISIPEHHAYRLYAELGGGLNVNSDRCLTRVTAENTPLGWDMKIQDATR
jgi:hypothetical protein